MTLEAPIKRIADRPLDEVAVARMWRALSRTGRRPRAATTRWFAVGAAAIAVAAAVVLFFAGGHGRDPGPLRLRGGGELAALEAAGAPAGGLTVDLDDGSTLVLAPNARLQALANTSSSLVVLLGAGRTTFDVMPNGPRRWIIECGLATVEVVGTRFVIERSETRLHVEVERGVVLVRGPLVKDRIARLAAGQSLDVEEPRAEREDTATSRAAPAPTGDGSAALTTAVVNPPPETTAPRATPTPARSSWRPLAEKGAFREAYDALTPDGLARQTSGASVEDLMLLADVARLSGHPGDAVGPLELVVREHPGPQAAIAAFTLGRIQLDALGRPGSAARAFDQAIASGLPDGLREDAYARVVEARARAGDAAGARAAAREYAARYPDGRRLAEVRAWAEHD